MRVSVFTLGGHELALEVDPGCSLLELKSRIAERIGVQPYRQTLLHRGVLCVCLVRSSAQMRTSVRS